METGEKPTFRILSLDGGGVKGAFAAAALAAWEDETGLRVVDHFDLIAGTSTGGILAIGIGLGLEAREILEFYRRHAATIFPISGVLRRPLQLVKRLRAPKHHAGTLRKVLAEVYRNRLFGESRVRLVVPAYDTVRGRIFLFKTAHHPRFRYDIRVPAADIALATSAAPTYFRAAGIPEHDGGEYVDGGVWANNPALVAVLEAHRFLATPLDNIRILNIGTTFEPGSVSDLADSGFAGWAPRTVGLLMNAQAEATWKQTMLLVGRENLHRIDCVSRPGEFRLDDASSVDRLAALGRGKAVEAETLKRVTETFLNGRPVSPFQPVHSVDAKRVVGTGEPVAGDRER